MRSLIFCFLTVFSLISCEEVIDLELNEMEPKLVIEASINLLKEDGAPYKSGIRLSTTSGFYDEVFYPVMDAEVQIASEHETWIFEPLENGMYRADFIPMAGTEYVLTVIYKGERYTAVAELISTSSFEHVEQRNDGGILGNQIELKAFFSDPVDETNFYYTVSESVHGIRRGGLADDFFNGNSIFSYYSHSDLKQGDEVLFQLFGVSESYFNYINLLLEQTGNSGPFGTTPSTVRGNIVNTDNPENYAFGYFRISEVSVLNYVVE